MLFGGKKVLKRQESVQMSTAANSNTLQKNQLVLSHY